MITDEQHHWVEQLLDEGGLSQRQIAAATGVGRSTVQSIAVGRRRRYFNPVDEPTPSEPPVRCPICGGLVYPPCRLCRLRQWQGQRRVWRKRPRGLLGAKRSGTKRCGGKRKRPANE
jgi:hypothetical protein